jgi:ERCC4-related helicase
VNWRLSDRVVLSGGDISARDAERQRRTAAEILRRLDRLPGIVLADEVGMGKTFVALAVAASVIEATKREHPVVVMVPPSVRSKWPREWEKFAAALKDGPPIRAVEEPVTSASEFLKLLDDPARTRKHLIFLTHGALTSGLSDPLLKLAIVQRAFRARRLVRQRAQFPRWARSVIPGLRYNAPTVDALLSTSPRRWRREIVRRTGTDPGDDPVPRAVIEALPGMDVQDLVRVLLADLPLHSSAQIQQRLQRVRRHLAAAVAAVWRACLMELRLDLPLLILDEAHHAKNRYTRLAGLFANEEAKADAEALRGELGGVFHRMLFLTATPFQLGHHELIEVLRRFGGVRWDNLDRRSYNQKLDDLESALDAAQAAALRLDRGWGRLALDDLSDGLAEGWWERPSDDRLGERLQSVGTIWTETRAKTRIAEKLLRPLVVRHLREDRDARREQWCGRAIATSDTREIGGLTIEGPAVLPFLLAARAQAIVAAEGVREHRRTRALFADGLASSFEAYRRTRSAEPPESQIDDVVVETDELPDAVRWYLDRIEAALPDEAETYASHPKLRATVRRVVDLWREREKALVFCFYVATGRALRHHIARAIEKESVALAGASLGVLDRLRQRLFDRDSPAHGLAEVEVRDALGPHLDGPELQIGVDLCMRFLRTGSFLVRYVDLGRPSVDGMRDAFERRDASGRTFRDLVGAFGAFIASREASERARYLEVLSEINVGDITVRDEEGERETLIANVRLVNGAVKQPERERLMLAFNTPFFPEVLVASSVMAEGVDLHLHCRHVVHHDLDWNPSVIEQRTGRLDRIGSKGEVTGLPVLVYEPFIEGTQDEKQFRVMKDRERWFNVVMGERLDLDEWSTDRLADRVEFPARAASGLAMDLSVVPARA